VGQNYVIEERRAEELLSSQAKSFLQEFLGEEAWHWKLSYSIAGQKI